MNSLTETCPDQKSLKFYSKKNEITKYNKRILMEIIGNNAGTGQKDFELSLATAWIGQFCTELSIFNFFN